LYNAAYTKAGSNEMNITTVAIPAINICGNNNLWIGLVIGFVVGLLFWKLIEFFPDIRWG
jgi:hypothetical protein